MFCLRTDLRSRFYIISSSEIRCGIQNRYNPSARQEIIIFRTNLRVIFLFTTASHLSLPRARSIQSTLPCPPSFLLLFLALQPYMGFGILHQIISGFSIFEEVAPISHFFLFLKKYFVIPSTPRSSKGAVSFRCSPPKPCTRLSSSPHVS
jgi:hypothetical protein